MQDGERQDFETMLAELFGALGLVLTKEKIEGFWRGLARMSIIEFGRCRDRLLQDLEGGQAVAKPFSVATLWDAKKRLRPQAPVTFEHEKQLDDGFRGDVWDIAANLHLLQHIRSSLAIRHGRYGAPPSLAAMRETTRKEHPNAHASPEFIANVHELVTAKRAWAGDMRDLAANCEGKVDPQLQREIWNDYISEAEARIATGLVNQLQLT